jgi:hypothetical protein
MKFWSQVDKTETCWNWTGCVINNGYGKIGYAGKQILVHRYSYEMSGDIIPEGMFVDHICSNRVCVRPDHLRIVTRKENSEHLTGAYKNSVSGVRGVTRQKNRWRAQVRHNGKLISVGSIHQHRGRGSGSHSQTARAVYTQRLRPRRLSLERFLCDVRADEQRVGKNVRVPIHGRGHTLMT